MVTIVVAKLSTVVGPRDSEPQYVHPDELPDPVRPGGPCLKTLLQSLEEIVGQPVRLMVLFPGGWSGKKPKAEDVEERAGNLLTLCGESAMVVAGATVCGFFDPRLYKTYLGTCCKDFGVALYPSPHPEDILNSTNVMLGDLVLAVTKASKHGQ